MEPQTAGYKGAKINDLSKETLFCPCPFPITVLNNTNKIDIPCNNFLYCIIGILYVYIQGDIIYAYYLNIMDIIIAALILPFPTLRGEKSEIVYLFCLTNLPNPTCLQVNYKQKALFETC